VQHAADHAPDGLLDPNTLSADGTTALTAYFPSPDGSRVAYALSQHGSDRQTVRVLGCDDEIAFVKCASLAWTRDGRGFYYLRFPEPGSVAAGDEQYYGRIYFHRLGDPQDADALVFAHHEREVVPLVHVTASGRWVVITAQRGASDDAEVFVADLRRPTAEAGRPQRVLGAFDAAYDFIEEADGRLFFRTTKDAPMGRIVSI